MQFVSTGFCIFSCLSVPCFSLSSLNHLLGSTSLPGRAHVCVHVCVCVCVRMCVGGRGQPGSRGTEDGHLALSRSPPSSGVAFLLTPDLLHGCNLWQHLRNSMILLGTAFFAESQSSRVVTLLRFHLGPSSEFSLPELKSGLQGSGSMSSPWQKESVSR